MEDLINKAREFAEKAHEGQKRKYTKEPYVVHVRNVEAIIDCLELSDTARICALLHDTIEDCGTMYGELVDGFGELVATGVLYLTDNTPHSEGNRAYRKEKYCKKLLQAPSEIQSVKLADMIDNTSSIVRYDPDFAKVYIKEKKEMLAYLHRGHPTLQCWARSLVDLSEVALINLKRTN